MGALFGSRTSQEKQLAGQFQSFIPRLEGIAGTTHRQGRKALRKGRKQLEEVGSFFKTLLSGDRGAVSQALSPEVQAVKDQYDATKRSIAEYRPRGGGQVAALGSLQEAEAGQIGSLFSTARSRGAEGLAGIGQALGSLGLGAEGIASQNIGTILQALLGQQGIEAGIAERKQSALGGIGRLVGSFLPI